MKNLRSISAGLMLLTAASASNVVFAHRPGGQHSGYYGGYRGGYHSGTRVGVYFGAPFVGFGTPFYGYPGGYGYAYGPYGYYGPNGPTTTIVTQSVPEVYVERGSVLYDGPASDGYWYYCSRPDGYYPYIKECTSSWQKVPSQPAQR
ncbi:MAG: hypothetical protein NVSMB6_23010 [Burkholderiaceae bacterium]